MLSKLLGAAKFLLPWVSGGQQWGDILSIVLDLVESEEGTTTFPGETKRERVKSQMRAIPSLRRLQDHQQNLLVEMALAAVRSPDSEPQGMSSSQTTGLHGEVLLVHTLHPVLEGLLREALDLDPPIRYKIGPDGELEEETDNEDDEGDET